MTKKFRINLSIIQPQGYVHSLGFLDVARYFRHQLRRLGAEVTISKNRLHEDAINFVFGAHLGFPDDWQQRNPCVFVNLEQLGTDGAHVESYYLDLLRRSAVVDYDFGNVSAYTEDVANVPIVPFGYAAYLEQADVIPLDQRPIDLLFFGAINERRLRFISRIKAMGWTVTQFNHPLYGSERDSLIRQAKAVLNCHFYESNRFEQVRAFHCLSLGTPIISECTTKTKIKLPPAFEDAVIWLDDEQLEIYFSQTFGKPDFYSEARRGLATFRSTDAKHDPLAAYAKLLTFAIKVQTNHKRTRSTEPWRPRTINLGSGRDYKPGWLNVDVIDRAEPDLVLDLSQTIAFPIDTPTRLGGRVYVEPGSIDLVYANNVLEHVPNLTTLMTNVLTLLNEGGEFQIEVPYERALTAWQDPTHVRALNENSWVYYTDWFWYLGWFTHRFEIAKFEWLDTSVQPSSKEQAAFMRVTLRKISTTFTERNTARTMQADFGGIDDDTMYPLPTILSDDPIGELQ